MNRSSSSLILDLPMGLVAHADTRSPQAHHFDAPSLEDRFGTHIGAALSERADAVEHDVGERLRVAREQALARAKARRSAVQPAFTPAVVSLSSKLAWQAPPWLARLAALLPLLLLVAGLVAIDEYYDRAQISAAAEVDVALLTDDLPVHAYSDPGFAEFLKGPLN
jgi:hypothetical protein